MRPRKRRVVRQCEAMETSQLAQQLDQKPTRTSTQHYTGQDFNHWRMSVECLKLPTTFVVGGGLRSIHLKTEYLGLRNTEKLSISSALLSVAVNDLNGLVPLNSAQRFMHHN